MISVVYTPKFVRQYKKLNSLIKEEIKQRIVLFKKDSNSPRLKVHKLHGDLAVSWSFSIDYKYRIVFKYMSRNEVILLAIDDHDVYKKT